MLRHSVNCRASYTAEHESQSFRRRTALVRRTTEEVEEGSISPQDVPDGNKFITTTTTTTIPENERISSPAEVDETCTQRFLEDVGARPLDARDGFPGFTAVNGIEKFETEEAKTPRVEVTINFETYFKWLEIIMWLTMAVGIIWALIYNFSKATRESCLLKQSNSDDYIYPFNVLPSLSRSMSSFRLGLAIWTISMAIVFVARLLSTHFLHYMYRTWYEDSTLNYIILKFAYIIDVLEMTSLLMIPAFSLDCDESFHSLFFLIFIVLTFTAEIIQYCTRFLKRAKGVVLDAEVLGYYKHIGWLVLLQAFFIAFMVTGNMLHKYTCYDYLYTVFAIGEYITVIINIRFKRDTIRFVK